MSPDRDLPRRTRLTGRNITKQRRAILVALRQMRSHPTATELFDRVRTQLPRVTLATIYRNLRVLQELGLVKEITGGAAGRFDATTHPHTHVRCTQCGRVEDIDVEFVDNLLDSGRERTDYVVTGCDVVFEGICPACQGRSGKQDHTEGS